MDERVKIQSTDLITLIWVVSKREMRNECQSFICDLCSKYGAGVRMCLA